MVKVEPKMNLGGGETIEVMSGPSSSSVSCKAGGAVSHQFPAGLKVLVVDDDPTCLIILEKMLRNCLYQVTKCNRAEAALSLLRENINGYDIVICDVHMPDMDGFKLLEEVGLLMDLPVIMMSADDSQSVVMKGVTHGACDYLIKPVRMEALKNIWQHVIRKKKDELKDNKDVDQSGSVEDGDQQCKPSADVDYSPAANEGNCKISKKRKDEDDNPDERDDTSNLKRQRVVWAAELHQQFVAAVNQIGIDKAVPKKILELMNVPGLTRENIASHLQKFRLYLRRLSDISEVEDGFNNSLMGFSDTGFGSMPSLNGFELQALAPSGQLSVQSLAALQAAAAMGQSTNKSAIYMPVLDQRNLTNFGASPNIRLGELQQQMSNNTKQMSLLHGMPSNMDPKQLTNLNSAQRFASMNAASHLAQSNAPFMQMNQQGRGRVMSETNGSQVPRMHYSMGQCSSPNAIPGGLLDPKGLGINGVHNPLFQASYLAALGMNQNTGLPANGFPVLSNLGMPTLSSKSILQQDVNPGINGSRGFVPSYDILNELHHQKPRNRGQNVRSMFDVSQLSSLQGTIDGSRSGLAQQHFSCGHGRQHPTAQINKGVSYVGEGGLSNTSNVRPLNPFVAENSKRNNSQRLPDSGFQNNIFPDQCGQDDLMSVILKQQHDSTGPLDNDFGIDGLLRFAHMIEDGQMEAKEKEAGEQDREGRSDKS
ncbi:winged helix/forkhead transcription factor [Lithospermum erythrorhizon]|uniref:Winged helix/forkhead transcription factor n=1 Tax=Lithospermum erythrorhizon TaxID=34254 RepID=A0AAV3S0Z5_LITER